MTRVGSLAILVLAVSCSHLPTTPPTPSPTHLVSPQMAPATSLPAPTPVPPTPTLLEPSPTPTALPLGPGNLGQLRLVRSLAQGDIVRSVAFSPSGEVLAAAGGSGRDFNIRLWDVRTGALERTLQGHRNIVWKVAFSPDGKLLASASSDGTAAVWDVAQGVMTDSLNFPNPVTSVAFSPDGKILAVGGVDRFPSAAVWTWAVEAWKPIRKLQASSNIAALAYSLDGRVLVAGGASGSVRVWRASSGVLLQMLNHPGQVADLALSPDGKRLAAALCVQSAQDVCQRGQVWIWDLELGTLVGQFGNFQSGAQAVTFAADGSILLAGSQDGTLAAWESASFAPLPVPVAPAPIETLAVSPDDRYVAVGCDDSKVYLYAVSR